MTENIQDPFSARYKKSRINRSLEAFRGYVVKYREYISLSSVFVIILFYVFVLSAPAGFPVGATVSVPEGSTLNSVSENLKDRDIIRSSTVFKILVLVHSGQGGVIAGDYFFNSSRNIFQLARRVVNGEYGLTPVSITIPEGSTAVEMAMIYESRLSNIDPVKFVDLAIEMEGYLFPDTYYFLPNVSEEEVIKTMRDNFDTRILEIEDKILASGRSLEDIVIMASLLEEEARTDESRRMISGLLWHRLDIGMRLQVDAVFPYFLGKNTFEVTLDDLQFDSPYNTYKYTGLPYGPISNPGLNSLNAAADPIENDYVFYLSDMNGNMHYSRTFEEHKRLKAIYIP